MKYLSVTFKEFNGKTLTSLCEYDTETKEKKYISIPNHIARRIIDIGTKTEVNSTLSSFRLALDRTEFYQD